MTKIINSRWYLMMPFVVLLASRPAHAQQMTLPQVLDSIVAANPVSRMYDADIRSMNEAARGARAWMPPEIGAGLFMTPYNVDRWKKVNDMEPGMGSFMVSIQQMIPNKRKLNAEAAYMNSMSAIAREEKNTALNELFATAKKAYNELVVLQKKLSVIGENEKILSFMIRNAEIRYKNGLEKINAYYKAKAALGNLESMKVMIENELTQKKIILNTLMNREKNADVILDTAIDIAEFSVYKFDTASVAAARSDLAAIDRTIFSNELRMESERLNLRPQFGVRFDHMIGFGAQPQQFTLMAMVRLPFVSWASRMTKANIESYRWRNEALVSQRQMILNESVGMATGMVKELAAKKKQLELYENNIIPALRNNYRSMLLAYEQNTEELFMLFDAWETLNMTQNEYFNQLQQLLATQAELEKILQFKRR